jgi:hypothetical protein
MPVDEQECGHEYVLGGVAYGCERAPHPIDGYGPAFRHAAGIDEELAEGTDEGDGHGPATLVTWGEDGRGDGQDWEIDWGTVEDYPGRRRWRGTRQPLAQPSDALSHAPGQNPLPRGGCAAHRRQGAQGLAPWAPAYQTRGTTVPWFPLRRSALAAVGTRAGLRGKA